MLKNYMSYGDEHPVLKLLLKILPFGIGVVLLYKIGYLIGKFIYFIFNV